MLNGCQAETVVGLPWAAGSCPCAGKLVHRGVSVEGRRAAPRVGACREQCPLIARFDQPLSDTTRHTLSGWAPQSQLGCTTPFLIPTGNGNTVRSFSTHGQQSAAKGSSTAVSRSDIRLIQHLDSSAHGLVRRWRLIGYFPIHLLPPTVRSPRKPY
jgi:hypothetical protein